jgi:hypothetical protein
MTELSGYTEIPIGGKNRPLKFNNLCIRKLSEKYDMTLGQCEDLLRSEVTDWPVSKFFDLFYFALVVGCKHSGREVDFTEDDVTEWFGEVTPQDMNRIIGALSKSMQIQLKNTKKATDKKK